MLAWSCFPRALAVIRPRFLLQNRIMSLIGAYLGMLKSKLVEKHTDTFPVRSPPFERIKVGSLHTASRSSALPKTKHGSLQKVSFSLVQYHQYLVLHLQFPSSDLATFRQLQDGASQRTHHLWAQSLCLTYRTKKIGCSWRGKMMMKPLKRMWILANF